MLNRIGRLFRTARYLTVIQVIYQVKSRVSRPTALRNYNGKIRLPSPLDLIPLPLTNLTPVTGKTFTYLNLSKTFDAEIDWNFIGYGKLWNYNLQYAYFINQAGLDDDIKVGWIRDLYKWLYNGKVKLEPYPVSIRCMNNIRFMSEQPERIKKYPDLQQAVLAELTYLHSHYEYHLLGNHLLENAFAMLMGGYFFKEDKWRVKAESILRSQLKEQILKDGAHFELSPMYHQIIFYRILEAISVLPAESEFLIFLKNKGSAMQGWLKSVSFSNGDIPHFNDSAEGIACPTSELVKIAKSLDIIPQSITLKESGYRRISGNIYECLIDVNGIRPSYQPGHNHADHLTFVLYVKGKPFIVDPGTSTYTISARRHWERSSAAHNTVTVHNLNQSEVWGGFRVGRRAKVQLENDSDIKVKATVSYFTEKYNYIHHTREMQSDEYKLTIIDSINSEQTACARFYLHPGITIEKTIINQVICADHIILDFKNAASINIREYRYAAGFNHLKLAKVIEVHFQKTLTSCISMIDD